MSALPKPIKIANMGGLAVGELQFPCVRWCHGELSLAGKPSLTDRLLCRSSVSEHRPAVRDTQSCVINYEGHDIEVQVKDTRCQVSG